MGLSLVMDPEFVEANPFPLAYSPLGTTCPPTYGWRRTSHHSRSIDLDMKYCRRVDFEKQTLDAVVTLEIFDDRNVIESVISFLPTFADFNIFSPSDDEYCICC